MCACEPSRRQWDSEGVDDCPDRDDDLVKDRGVAELRAERPMNDRLRASRPMNAFRMTDRELTDRDVTDRDVTDRDLTDRDVEER